MAKNHQHTHHFLCVCVDKNMKNGLFRQKLFRKNKVLEIKIFYNLFSVKIFKQNV
jgi:hypothetical protein